MEDIQSEASSGRREKEVQKRLFQEKANG